VLLLAFSYVGLMKHHPTITISYVMVGLDGVCGWWERLAFDLGFIAMLDFDIACLLTFVLYRKNESRRHFPSVMDLVCG